jgi:CRP-like cAMP-binding protein
MRRIPANELIWLQGEPIPLTLVVDGYAAFRRTTLEGQQLITQIVRPGEMYGMISIAGSLAAADLLALTECVVAAWQGSSVRELAANDPRLALDVIDRLASLLTTITERLDGFLHQDARRRVIRVLAHDRDLFFGDPPILPRTHLPALVGTTREMTSRVLRALEREGSIARVGRTGLQLLDPTVLDSVLDAPPRPAGPRGQRTTLRDASPA